jgi:AraC-like DNA-binding protein
MKPQLLNKKLKGNIQLSVHQDTEFLKLWHYHPEFELIYISNGNGTLYVGDFIGDYKENDIILLGKNVPHMFHSQFSIENSSYSKAYVFHINDLFLNDACEYLSDFSFLENLMKISKRGVMFRQKQNSMFLQNLDTIDVYSPAETILKVFQILLRLSEYPEYTNLGSINWLDRFHTADKRINNVIEYIMLHFKEDINLEKAAEISAMNKSSFCRYFKKSTGKPFVSFLNEIRINYSCKLLLETSPSRSISEAAYISGFNNVSYYNRIFKKVIGVSPSEYKTIENKIIVKDRILPLAGSVISLS